MSISALLTNVLAKVPMSLFSLLMLVYSSCHYELILLTQFQYSIRLNMFFIRLKLAKFDFGHVNFVLYRTI